MTFPARLGEQCIEADVAILSTLLNISAFNMTDPLYTYTLLPYATDAYEIGSATEYYREGWFLALQIGDDPADYQGTIWGSGSVTRPQLEMSAAAPSASAAGNFSLVVIEAPSYAGTEDVTLYLSGGDENTSDIPFMQLDAGSISLIFTEGLGLMIEEAMRITEVSSDPTAPGEGEMVMWQSDGGGDGDDGDIMVKIQANSTTKTITLIDFSAF